MIHEGPAAISARDVVKHYPVRGGSARKGGSISALEGVTIELREGETVALVGESGCGKSTLTRLLARLESPTAGELLLAGTPLSRKLPSSSRAYSHKVQLILQDPYASLNPAHRISYTLTRALRIHTQERGRDALEARAAKLLDRVQLTPGEDYLAKYPHELSGGQRQRVAIARALAAEPRVLIADEPVSMLDVSLRFGVLSLLRQIREESNLALLYVTHDISTARYFADRILVLYAGRAVEEGAADQVVLDPKHPYTKMLIAAAPDPRRVADLGDASLGEPPDPSDPPSGCRFHPRCPMVMPRCSQENPALGPIDDGRSVACWLFAEENSTD